MLKIARMIAKAAELNNWRVLIVGGFARDHVLGLPSKDLDLEIYGDYTITELTEFLTQFGEVNAVGSRFGVLKLSVNGVDLDVSAPRRENKTGRGNKGFVVNPDPTMTPKEAAGRRDFTMNTLALDPLTGEIVDPFGGIADLKAGVLKATGPAFSEDPTRVRRGAQFCGRFNLVADDETLEMSEALLPETDTIAQEMLWVEWEKWARKSVSPSKGLMFLQGCGWLKLDPELFNLVGCKQEPSHHPEGDAFVHTMLTVDAMADICQRESITGEDKVVLVLAALLHDVGKPTASEFNKEKGRITSYGHDTEGKGPASRFLERNGAPKRIIERVLPLVTTHMRHVNFHTGGRVTGRLVRRLADDLKPTTIREWAMLVEADASGRSPLPGGLPEPARTMLEMAEELAVRDAAPKPILMGRHLIEMGMVPSPMFGKVLGAAFQDQLDGAFADLTGAMEWLTELALFE